MNYRNLGDKDDLNYAKKVVVDEYAVVGALEYMDETLNLLEAKVPGFFKGIKMIYKSKRKYIYVHVH